VNKIKDIDENINHNVKKFENSIGNKFTLYIVNVAFYLLVAGIILLWQYDNIMNFPTMYLNYTVLSGPGFLADEPIGSHIILSMKRVLIVVFCGIIFFTGALASNGHLLFKDWSLKHLQGKK